MTALAVSLLLLGTVPDAGAPKGVEERVARLEAEVLAARVAAESARAAAQATADELEQLKADVADTERVVTALGEREELIRANSVAWAGYADVGFFAVQGDGSGVRKDVTRAVPGGDDLLSTWVLRGDPLATTVNSRGDVADVGASRAFTGLGLGGRPSFLVNAVNLQLRATIGNEVLIHAMVDLLPRERALTNLAFGDLLDVKLANVSWRRRFGFGELVVWAGKFDSVLGIEYRVQEAPDRLTVTPSLLCRYTCGRAVGLRARGLLLGDRLEVLATVTNGSNQLEVMPWGAEAGFNASPALAGRIGALLPVANGLELSVSGQVGVQERQADPTVWQFHAGAAAKLDLRTLVLTAEGVFGRAAGKTGLVAGEPVACAAASCLVYRGAYLLVGWRALRWLTPYGRVDWRSGTMRSAREWLYESVRLRATAGVRVDAWRHLALKAEYTFNRELLGLDFPDDVFTTSLVVSY